MPSSIWVFVNEDLQGDAVAILLEGAELIEINGQLFPMMEMAPMHAMRMAEALVECAGKVIQRNME